MTPCRSERADPCRTRATAADALILAAIGPPGETWVPSSLDVGACSTCSSWAPAPPGSPPGSRPRRLGLDALVVDKATLPARQDLRRRAHHRRAAPARRARARRPRAPVVRRRSPRPCSSRPTGREVVLPLPDDGEYAGVVPRRELDAALVDLARAPGRRRARRHRPSPRWHRRPTTRRRRRSTTAPTSTRALGRRRRRPLLRPCGAWSQRRRRRARPSSARGTRSASTSAASTTAASGCCSSAISSPGTRGCSRVGDGRANVGFGVLRDDVTAGGQAARRAVARRGRTARACAGSSAGTPSPTAPHRAWPIPATYDREPPRRTARVLFVGDAANVVDPMTGEGIAQALETGMLAARAVADGGHPSNVAARYRADVDARARRRPALRGAAATHPARHRLGARAAIRAAGLTAVDPPQLRPLDVRGLPARGRHDAAALAPRHVHAVGRLLGAESRRRLTRVARRRRSTPAPGGRRSRDARGRTRLRRCTAASSGCTGRGWSFPASRTATAPARRRGHHPGRLMPARATLGGAGEPQQVRVVVFGLVEGDDEHPVLTERGRLRGSGASTRAATRRPRRGRRGDRRHTGRRARRCRGWA